MPLLVRHRRTGGTHIADRRVAGVHRAAGLAGPTRRYTMIVAMLATMSSLPIIAGISAGSANVGDSVDASGTTPFIAPPSEGPVVIPQPPPSALPAEAPLALGVAEQLRATAPKRETREPRKVRKVRRPARTTESTTLPQRPPSAPVKPEPTRPSPPPATTPRPTTPPPTTPPVSPSPSPTPSPCPPTLSRPPLPSPPYLPLPPSATPSVIPPTGLPTCWPDLEECLSHLGASFRP
ncbi:hypothetical protein RB614_38025 [Phytohabitans sp. ZYX-F-186]|uniref:Uncharacterized protein n=1 Tax=Phytohabitans maris TaxID=3071409 RepID=A0ABU0ZTE3_9ACTN|nr:hypothetical protein [Phytohabitans sp. ZYX-F-186]MDQ7910308.1 hypothetical protein [Phytohabitans sp. ZYX-F-186]